jgi:hypothetical protein
MAVKRISWFKWSLIIAIIGVSAFLYFRSDVRLYLTRYTAAPDTRSYRATCTAIQGALVKTEDRRKLLVSSIGDSLFPFWKGTPWAFHGTTETPGKGKIACGYFVTTVLRDIGVPVKRAAYAQMASEDMIKKLVNEKHITRYSKQSVYSILQHVRKKGQAVYIVGLDNHVGFLVYQNNEGHFIHSSGRFPFCVVSEPAITSRVLHDSKYHVLGCISCDDEFLDRWENRVTANSEMY